MGDIKNASGATSVEEVREYITDFLRRELIGPDPGLPAIQLSREEILRPQDPPRLRYSSGVLFPLSAGVTAQVDAEEEEVEAASVVDFSTEEMEGAEGVTGKEPGDPHGETVETDQGINLANEYLPSAMGLSALVEIPKQLRVRIAAARYEKKELDGAGRINNKGDHVPYLAHWRIPIDKEFLFDRDELLGDGIQFMERILQIDDNGTVLRLQVLSRPYALSDSGSDADSATIQHPRIITFSLINGIEARSSKPKDDECFFQCSFTVDAPSGKACFMEYPERPGLPLDKEEASLRLLYRHRKVFAVGHGCAPEWDEPVEDTPGATTTVRTETLPTYEVRPVVPKVIPDLELSMLVLSDPDNNEALYLCRRLANEYREWIEKEESRIVDEVPKILQGVARGHMNKCRTCLERIDYGIRLLNKNKLVRKAFAMMNKAMLMQQIHYRLSSENPRKWVPRGHALELARPFIAPKYDDSSTWGISQPERTGNWRPFQLAFILMNLRSIAEPECDEREIVDLIWFPTGGGKTEAYLGLTSFTILLRRLNRPENAGTTVLMRYTLRLLTAQQYQRAASLICALEYLRRGREDILGPESITIGLWVGSGVTPNREADANKAFDGLLKGERENPFVMLSCPWCGAHMGPVQNQRRVECKGYRKLGHPNRIRFICDDENCAFSDDMGLPLHVIDEAIYRKPPTLLIGTVDKFAMLPWKPESRSLFGLVHEEFDPPELIIQDELHLISGPLGSMVGHYETVIDLLCERNHDDVRIPAKIVASTATISRASEQIAALYGRDQSLLFPPQGLRAGSSFFAKEDEESSGRTYLGVFATALPSHVTAQIRVLSSLLQAVKTLEVADEKLRDPYWTLMVYFNSLRELGHAATLIRADIREYLNAVWDRLGLTHMLGGKKAASKRRFINNDLELTSRIHSSRIPETLQKLFNLYGNDGETRPVDVCLATNMIQVGLDVPRLSLMAVAGQPKTTSEYIQATSRVGRRHPGLVVMVYNPARPRDRSHYERFRAYHHSLYQHVEPTSVTPFAIPVRERALHALVVTLVRFWGNNAERSRPDPHPRDALFDKIRNAVLDRVQRVDSDELQETMNQLDRIIDEWKRAPTSKYSDSALPTAEEVPLMHRSGSQQLTQWGNRSIPTPTSMRNVDATCDAEAIATYPTFS